MDVGLDPVLLAKQQRMDSCRFRLAWQRPSARSHSVSQAQLLTTFCATPSMNSWHKQIAGHIDTLTGSCVQRLHKRAGRWQLLDAAGQVLTEADKAIVTCPAEASLCFAARLRGFSSL